MARRLTESLERVRSSTASGLRRVRSQLASSATSTADPTPADEDAGPATSTVAFEKPKIADRDVASNIEWNRQRWGQRAGWDEHDQFGYRWSKGHQQRAADIAGLADGHLRPFMGNDRNLVIVELSPGAGRFTAELIRYAERMVLVDLNESAIDTCRERFRFYPTPIEYFTNDGMKLPMVDDGTADVFACYDSMVHMHPDVVGSYVGEGARILRDGGIAWLDHSGKGQRDAGHRSAMTSEKMVELATAAGLEVVDQRFRNDWDCISILRKG